MTMDYYGWADHIGVAALAGVFLILLLVFGGVLLGGIVLSLRKSRSLHEQRMALLEKRKELLERGIPAADVERAMNLEHPSFRAKHPIETSLVACGIGSGLILSVIILRPMGLGGLLLAPAAVIGALMLTLGVARLLAYQMRKQEERSAALGNNRPAQSEVTDRER